MNLKELLMKFANRFLAVLVPLTLVSVACTNDETTAEDPIKAASVSDQGKFTIDQKTGVVSFKAEVLYFKFDDHTLTEEGKSQLNLLANYLKENQKSALQIDGHCDERGSTEYNLALGEMRAKSVKKYLAEAGISEKRLATISFGEEKPAAQGRGEDVYAKNRRAEFVLTTYQE
jgi:peptidoglycan-associated lipoprotein